MADKTPIKHMSASYCYCMATTLYAVSDP